MSGVMWVTGGFPLLPFEITSPRGLDETDSFVADGTETGCAITWWSA